MKTKDDILLEGFTRYKIDLTEEQLEELMYDLGALRVRRQGNNLQFDHCILHHNNSPTLGISLEDGRWNCFSCGAKGPDITSLVARAKRVADPVAQAYILNKFNLSIGRKGFSLGRLSAPVLNRTRFTVPPAALKLYTADPERYEFAAAYLKFSREQTEAHCIGFWGAKKRLVFPVFHKNLNIGGLVTRSMRDDCPKDKRWYNLDSGEFKKEFVILGEHLNLTDKPLVIVEGPKDYYTMLRHGYQNVRATLGTSFSDWQVEYIKDTKLPVVPLFDQDSAGQTARRNLTKLLRKAGVSVWSYQFPDMGGEKPDPGNLTPTNFSDLVRSFRAFSPLVRVT